MDIVLIVMSIVGMFLSVLLLKDFKVYKRIIMVIGIDLFLYFFHAPITYISVVLLSIIGKNIDLYFWIVIGMFLSFSVLTPMYAYSINQYKKEKKGLDFVRSLFVTTGIFIIFLCIFMIICPDRIAEQ